MLNDKKRRDVGRCVLAMLEVRHECLVMLLYHHMWIENDYGNKSRDITKQLDHRCMKNTMGNRNRVLLHFVLISCYWRDTERKNINKHKKKQEEINNKSTQKKNVSLKLQNTLIILFLLLFSKLLYKKSKKKEWREKRKKKKKLTWLSQI